MITIKKPRIENANGKSRCICELFVDDELKTVWFETDEKYGQYLCDDRADAYVIGLLSYAMRNRHDIKCEVPVTEELLYNISVILIPSLAKYGKNISKIKILAETLPAITEGSGVGTGCSCGVDSFDAIKSHTDSDFPDMDLTHICINNVGAFNKCYDAYGREKAKNERYAETEKVAKELGLELIETDSNFSEVIYQSHARTHTFSSIFAVYMLQKLWKIYYYASSGYDYSAFTLENNDEITSDHYELLSLQCFSTSGIKIYSEGGERTRLEKTINIADYPPAQKHLHVCINKPYNCNVCPKCKRTLVTLDLLGKLDDFSDVFDTEYYRSNRSEYYKWLYRQHMAKDAMNEPVYKELSKREDFKNAVFVQRIIYYPQKGYGDLREKLSKVPELKKIYNKLKGL